MTWFEAIVLWKLTSVVALFTIAASIMGIGILVQAVTFLVEGQDASSGVGEFNRLHRKKIITMYVLFVVFTVIAALTPTTSQAIGIIAAKKGVDAVTSGRGEELIEKTAKCLEKALDVVDKKLEDEKK